MDRNCGLEILKAFQDVALRKESVDRNKDMSRTDAVAIWSLSARRAWIEML